MFKQLSEARTVIYIAYLIKKRLDTKNITFSVSNYKKTTKQKTHSKRLLEFGFFHMRKSGVAIFNYLPGGTANGYIVDKNYFKLVTKLSTPEIKTLLLQKSKHTINLFMIINSYNYNNFRINYINLRAKLSIPFDRYVSVRDFKKRILKDGLQKIKINFGININYKIELDSSQSILFSFAIEKIET